MITISFVGICAATLYVCVFMYVHIFLCIITSLFMVIVLCLIYFFSNYSFCNSIVFISLLLFCLRALCNLCSCSVFLMASPTLNCFHHSYLFFPFLSSFLFSSPFPLFIFICLYLPPALFLIFVASLFFLVPPICLCLPSSCPLLCSLCYINL